MGNDVSCSDTDLSPVWLYVRCQYTFDIPQTLHEIQRFADLETIILPDICVEEIQILHNVWRHLHLTWFCDDKTLSKDLIELFGLRDFATLVSQIKGPYTRQCDEYCRLMEENFGPNTKSDVLSVNDEGNKPHHILIRHRLLVDAKHIARELLADRLTR